MKKTLLAAVLLTSCIVCMASSPQKKKFDRGFGSASSLFVPKGTMTAGASLSYHRYDAGNGDIGYEFMSLITGVEGTLSTVNISPAVLYFIGNNTAIGARFGYAYTSMDVNGASISLDSDNGFDLSNRFMENQNYSGSVVLRNYLPLFGSKVFAMFNEVRLGCTLGQGKSYQLEDEEKNGTFTDSYALKIGLNPGLVAFLTNDFALEVSLSVLELNYSYNNQTKNQVYKSSLSHFGTTFKPNLLSLNFSLMYYFPIGR